MKNKDLYKRSKQAKSLESREPTLLGASDTYTARKALEEVLPEGSSLGPTSKISSSGFYGGMPWLGGSVGSGGNGSSLFHAQRPYLPEYESPDRYYYPTNRKEANRYWRFFYKMDPMFGTAIEMYSQMMFGEYDIIVGDEKDKGIRNALQGMCEKVRLLDNLQALVREFLVLGEAFPHLYFDKESGLWSYMSFVNPDDIEVIDAPFIKSEPILNYVPDEDMVDFFTDTSLESREVQKKYPSEFVNKVRSNQKIRLSNKNFSFIPRKLHPYDVRGNSIASRLWRIWMVEDAVYNATISIFRRFACFVAGTKILTSDGIKPVEEIHEGMTVYSGDGRLKEVKASWSHDVEETVKIKAVGTELLECTPNHKFKIFTYPRTCRCGCGEELVKKSGGTPRFYVSGHHSKFKRDSKTGRFNNNSDSWKILSEKPYIRIPHDYDPIQIVKAEDLQAGDYLLIPRNFDVCDIEVNDENKAKARLLGYYVAEGSKRLVQRKPEDRYGVCFTFSPEEYDTHASDVESLCDVVGVNCRKRFFRKNDPDRLGVTTICIDNIKDLWFTNWLFKHGNVYSQFKRLSQEVMSWPLDLKKELLIGMYRGDGHKTKDGHEVSYATVSPSLAYQLRLILAQLGICGCVWVQDKSNEGWSDVYGVRSYGDDGNRYLRDLIWGEKLEVPDRNNSLSTWIDNDYVYVPITSVEYCNSPVRVYNMTVEGDKSYIANGVASMNSPLKIMKLGDPNTGYIPSPEREAKLHQMLVQAESDPNATLVWDYAINFETWGDPGRAINIGREHDTIEKVKLVALGLSKSFLHGETTFSSSKAGLQVFLRRLLSLRQFFESVWIYPKFFQPIVEVNQWYKSTPPEVAHNYRIKRTAQELRERDLLIRPKIKWRNNLDPRVDADLLNALGQLKNMGFPVSNNTLGAAVAVDPDEEIKNKALEWKREKEISEEILGKTYYHQYKQEQQVQQQAKKPPGAPGSGAMPVSTSKPSVSVEGNPPGSGDTTLGDNSPLSDSIEQGITRNM